MLDIILLKHSRRFTTSPPGVMQQTKAEHHSHSNSDWSTLSHNSFLLRWERCHKAQVAIQLFDEHDNYFSHMPRRFKAPALNPTSGRGGLRPKTLFATNKPWLLTFSLFIICSFISRCLPFFFFKIVLILAIPSTTPAPGSLTNPHPYPIHLIMVSLSRGKCHYGNRGRGSGGLSMGKRGGGDRKIEKDCELASAEESMSGHLTQVWLKKGR